MKVVLILLLAILAVAFATKSIDTPVVYTTAARSYPYATHAGQTLAVETVPSTVQTASLVPVPEGNPSSQYHTQDSLGQYSYGYATADGQSKVENKAADGTVSGQYSYFDPEGKKVELSYIADENGFRASGNNLPVAPEVPDSLEDAYEEATDRLATARYKALVTSPQTYRYSIQPAPYVTYPVTGSSRRGSQYYTNSAGSGYYPGYAQRYAYGTPSVTGFQRYSTGYPAYQYYTTSGSPTAYQYYTAGRPTGFQYYTSSYAPYTTYPTTYGYTPTRYTHAGPTRYTYSPTRYSYAPTGYTGAKSGYTSYGYSY